MRADVLAGTSIVTWAASYPLAAVNDYLTLASLVVAIVSGLVSLYFSLKRRGR